MNLRIPIGFVETALKFVPGLGGDQSQRIRDAVRSGAVSFVHPLLASTLLELHTSEERRAVHLALADTVDDPDHRVEVIGFQWQWQFRYPDADIVVVGLAPAAHGANRTGRPFSAQVVPGTGLMVSGPNSSKANSCGLRRPAAKISTLLPSGSARKIAPWCGVETRRPSALPAAARDRDPPSGRRIDLRSLLGAS